MAVLRWAGGEVPRRLPFSLLRRGFGPAAAQAEFELGIQVLTRGAVAMLPSLPAGKR